MAQFKQTPFQPESYDSRTIMFHWLSAALVLGLWTLGQCIDFFPRGTSRVTARSLHISFGLLLGLVLALRLAWRRQGGVELPAADAGAMGRVAISVHHALYLLMATLVVVGVACVWIRGDNIFNLFKVPAFDPGNKALREEAVDLHGLLANILLFVAGLHGAAAVWHHLHLKDGVLRRMWPGLRDR